MTRKHYEAIAAAFARIRPDRDMGASDEQFDQWATDVLAISAVLAADNVRFDRARFYAACGAFGYTADGRTITVAVGR